MCCKSFWLRIVPFALTLLLSLFVVEYYVVLNDREHKIEPANQQPNQTIVTSESKTNNSSLSKCIEFGNNSLYRKKINKDIEEIKNLLEKNDVASRKKAKFYLENLKKIQDKYARIRSLEATLSALKKTNGTHKLFYIENCIRYSE